MRCLSILQSMALIGLVGPASGLRADSYAAEQRDTATNGSPGRPSSSPLDASSGSPANASEELAKQLSNPISSLISVPFQFNYDRDIGEGDRGERALLNLQPVLPMQLSARWNLVSRTIVPLIDQDDVPPGSDARGMGDVLQSFFFSPAEPTDGGWIWGAGPVLLVPTASDDDLGGERWATGPTLVGLRQAGPWTYGLLMNHLWSVAGDEDRDDVNATFLQPFLSYTTASATTFTANLESTYDWERDELAVPLNLQISRVFRLGGQRVSIGGGARYWLEDTDTSPEGFGLRISVTLLFPR